jgi:hypothetical protein
MALVGRPLVPIPARRSRGLSLAAGCALVCGISLIPTAGLAQEGTSRPRQPQLKLGAQQRTSAKEISVKLEFSPEGQIVNQVRAEIVLPPGPWQYRKAQATPGSPVAISARQQREKRQEGKVMVVLLTISSRKREIALGAVAELYFTRNGPNAPNHLDLEIRKFDVESSKEQTDARPPLEPPTAEPPANPVPTCFFFTH